MDIELGRALAQAPIICDGGPKLHVGAKGLGCHAGKAACALKAVGKVFEAGVASIKQKGEGGNSGNGAARGVSKPGCFISCPFSCDLGGAGRCWAERGGGRWN